MNWLGKFFGNGGRREAALTPAQQRAIADWRALPSPDLSLPHARSRYVVADVETSGLHMQKDKLISIGAVAVVNGMIDINDAFEVVLRQEVASANENILVHGIGGSAQREGMAPPDALIAFLDYLGKAPLVAYHAIFDQAMIERAMEEFLGITLGQTWIDLAWVMPDLFRDHVNQKLALDDWLNLFDIENIQRHNALSDAYATAKLLQVAMACGKQRGADSPKSFVEIEKARRWNQRGG